MRRRLIILGLAIVALIAGNLVGNIIRGYDGDVPISDMFWYIMPEMAGFDQITETTARALNADGEVISYIGFGESIGFGGPILVGTIITPQGVLQTPIVISHNETPSWFFRVNARLNMFEGRSPASALVPGYDLDAISGATMTQVAISDAVRTSAHSIAVDVFGLTPEQPARRLIGPGEIALLLIFALATLVCLVEKLSKYRIPLLIGSIVVMGFWLNRPLSITNFSLLLMGHFPSLTYGLLLYIVILGALLPILILGKNIYCRFICPFCGILELLHKLTGKNVPLKNARKWFMRLRYLLLFVSLMVVAVTANTSIFIFEPFGVVFGIELASPIYLIIISAAALITGLWFKRIWCAGFCPAGAFLDTINSARRDIAQQVSKYIKSRKAQA